MASGSAVGSGKRVSTARSGGVPLGAKARSRWRRRLAPPRGRGARGSPRATARRRSTNRIASSSATAGSRGRPRTRRSGVRRGRKGSTSSPRERDPISALPRRISPPAPTRPAPPPGRSGEGKAAQPGADLAVGREERGRQRREERGLRARRHRDELVRLRGEGRHGRGEARAGDARPGPTRERLLQGRADALGQRRLGPPQPLEPVDLGLQEPEGDVGRSDVPATAGLNAARRSKAASSSARSASGSASRNVASGASRCADPSGIPRRTPSARAAGSASSTVPFDQGFPPRTTGPAGHEPEAGAASRGRRRCGRWR